MTSTDFSDLRAIFINCSIKKDKAESHTQRLIDRAAGVMRREGVQVDEIYALDYKIAFGMLEDGAEIGVEDDWPKIQKRIMAADILVLCSPIWLGVKSSMATLVRG